MLLLESAFIMKRRTTLTTEADDLETLRAEAGRLGVSLNAILSEIVARRASEIRSERRPRLGVGRSGRGDLSHRSAEDEEAPARTPWRS